MDEFVTRAEFEQFKRHIEQKTDEIKAIRVDVHNVDVETLKQEFHTVSDIWLETLQEHYTEHKNDIAEIKSTVATKQDLTTLADTMEERFKDLLIKYLRPSGNGH